MSDSGTGKRSRCPYVSNFLGPGGLDKVLRKNWHQCTHVLCTARRRQLRRETRLRSLRCGAYVLLKGHLECHAQCSDMASGPSLKLCINAVSGDSTRVTPVSASACR